MPFQLRWLRLGGPPRIAHQEPGGLEANARRQGCRGAIHRARSSPYCTLDDLHKLLSRAVAARPLASSTAGRGEKSGLPRRDKSGVGREGAEIRGVPTPPRIGPTD